jgi:DNA-binding SARP family transcriptional activator
VLEFRILGPLEVVGENGPVPLGGPRQRGTLALLLLSANRVVSVEQFAEELYAGRPPASAVTQVQRQISELRSAFGAPSEIETRAPGYVIHLSPEQLDLTVFERDVADAAEAFDRGDVQSASELLRRALALWRGPPLSDLAYESLAQAAVQRLEEIRLAALEQRIGAELRLGRHAALVAELRQLETEHPLREGFRAQLMLALYRSGRQAEALGVYRATRDALVDAFGIEPTPALQELERAILRQDPSLAPPGLASADGTAAPDRAVLVLPSRDEQTDALLALAAPLARPTCELIVARLVGDESELDAAVSATSARRPSLPATARTAVFTTPDPVADAVRLVTAYDVALVLLDAPADLDLSGAIGTLLERSPADVGILAGSPYVVGEGKSIFVPFGGGVHDWAALELAASLARAAGAPITLVGTKADPHDGGRDSSRLLADAALAIQRVVGVEAEPLLTDRAEQSLVAAVEPASLVVVGLSPDWRRHGLGAVRRALLRDARPPVLLVHRGPRPGVLTPREAQTRFTWSVGS